MAFIRRTSNDTNGALSQNDSGVVNVTLQGSVTNQPKIGVTKIIKNGTVTGTVTKEGKKQIVAVKELKYE